MPNESELTVFYSVSGHYPSCGEVGFFEQSIEHWLERRVTMSGHVRIRLNFQGSPAFPDMKNCWFLVDTSTCCTISDLEYLIMKRFELTSKNVYIHLFLDDYLLPSREKIEVIQHNDKIRWFIIALAFPTSVLIEYTHDHNFTKFTTDLGCTRQLLISFTLLPMIMVWMYWSI